MRSNEALVKLLSKNIGLTLASGAKSLDMSVIDFIRDRSVNSLDVKSNSLFFERIFTEDEITKLSIEPFRYFNRNESSNITTIKKPKTTVLGRIGVFLDNKFD